MSSRDNLGTVELMVLLSVLRLGDEAYGVPISHEIAEHTGREVMLGSIYASLERLEAKGLVTSRLGEPTAERGGRAKKFFKATARGVREARETQRALLGLARGVRQLKGELA